MNQMVGWSCRLASARVCRMGGRSSETGSRSRSTGDAPRALAISQRLTTVAKQVDQLEETTGVCLFRRTTRGITLTEAGQNWTDRFRSVLRDVDHLLEDASKSGQELEGSLRIKAPTTLTVMHLGQVLADFQRRHPKISLEIVLADRPVNQDSPTASAGHRDKPKRPR